MLDAGPFLESDLAKSHADEFLVLSGEINEACEIAEKLLVLDATSRIIGQRSRAIFLLGTLSD